MFIKKKKDENSYVATGKSSDLGVKTSKIRIVSNPWGGYTDFVAFIAHGTPVEAAPLVDSEGNLVDRDEKTCPDKLFQLLNFQPCDGMK